VGAFAVLDSSVDPLFDDTRNRPAIAQTFVETVTGGQFTAVVNHLKSKGSPCLPDDPDTGDGQGNCNLTRTSAAVALAAWAGSDPTLTGAEDVLILGDLNAYAMEDPITALEGAGWTDLIESFVGSGWGDGAYSFNFFSQSGYLDHGMASPSVLPKVTGANFWHINADEPSALDYNSFNQLALYQPDQYRASDHDPVIVGLDLSPMKAKQQVVADLSALLPTGDTETDSRIEKAIQRVEDSLNPDYWTSDSTLDPEHGDRVFDRERQAVIELEKVAKGGGPAAGASLDAIFDLIGADQQLAGLAIGEAIAAGGDQTEIDKALEEYAKAMDAIADGDYAKAVEHYRKAWQNAIKAL